MTREEVFSQLLDIFADAFDRDDLSITETTVAGDVEGWDSLMQMNLIEIIEGDFDIRFELDEIMNMKDVGHMVDLILAKVS